MNFGMIMLNQYIAKMQNYATSIQIVLLFTLKHKILVKILKMMLKKYLIHQIMTVMITELYQ